METTKPRRRWIWIVLITLVTLAALCLGGVFYWRLSVPLPGMSNCVQTASMVVDATKLRDYSFCVPKDTNLTLSISNHKDTCKISGASLNKSLSAQSSFSLPAGQYKLSCGIQGVEASITSR